MFVIENTVISDDIAEKQFVCNLQKCKGACCIEGDAGAPLEEGETAIMDAIYEQVKPYMTLAGIAEVEAKGIFEVDTDGDLVTPTIGGRECAYAVYGEDKVLKCAFEMAYKDGKTAWPKPISCHLYPVRLKEYDQYVAVNYDYWEICNDACSLGKELQIPVYKFLKGPLIRRFGQPWYDKLCQLIAERESMVN